MTVSDDLYQNLKTFTGRDGTINDLLDFYVRMGSYTGTVSDALVTMNSDFGYNGPLLEAL